MTRAIDHRRGYSAHGRAGWFWLYERDPDLGFHGRPDANVVMPTDFIRHDHDGFRDDRSLDQIRAIGDRRLVVCVGDGATYGISAGTNERTYPAVLERELRRLSDDPRFVVLNAGLPSWGTAEVRTLLERRLLALRPEAVVAMSFKEDFEYLGLTEAESGRYAFYPLRISAFETSTPYRLLMRSAVVARLSDKRRPAGLDDLGLRRPWRAHLEPSPAAVRQYLDLVRGTARACRAAGSAFLWVDQPIHYSTCMYSDEKTAAAERLRTLAREACRSERASVLEAQQPMDWSGLKLGDDNLLGTVGYERLARLLAPQVLAALSGTGGAGSKVASTAPAAGARLP